MNCQTEITLHGMYDVASQFRGSLLCNDWSFRYTVFDFKLSLICHPQSLLCLSPT